MVGLPNSKTFEDTFSSVDRRLACDRRTDVLRRYAYASRGKNEVKTYAIEWKIYSLHLPSWPN